MGYLLYSERGHLFIIKRVIFYLYKNVLSHVNVKIVYKETLFTIQFMIVFFLEMSYI